MPKRGARTPAQRQLRSATALLIGAIFGLLTTFLSGFALVPRVRLVEVCIVVASAVGAGAALAAAVLQFKQARVAAQVKVPKRPLSEANR